MNGMGKSVHSVNRFILAGEAGASGSSDAASLIYDRQGNRKYLTAAERRAFLGSVRAMDDEVRTFGEVLAYSGARLSEVLALTPARIDLSARLVIVECLKKRRQGVFRAIPIPDQLLVQLNDVHKIGERQVRPELRRERLWPWCRTIAWMHIKKAMETAHVVGPQATPKGLRHAFAITALQSGVPINLVRRWLGHSRLSTTEIYAEAVGPEEQALAALLWKTF